MPAEVEENKPEDRKRRDTALQRAWRNWGDHPAVAILAVLGSIATIVSLFKPEENKAPVSAEAPANEPAPSQPNGGIQQAELIPGTRLPKSKAEPDEPGCATRIAGRWDWHTTGGIVAIAETGTMAWYQSPDDRLPLVTGTWECDRTNQRRVTFRWTQTGMVDTMVLSRDGQRFAGANMGTGFKLSGTRSSR